MILIASDHGGYELKEELESFLRGLGEEVQDLGTDNGDPVDYPEFGLELAERVGRGDAEKGILLCGTGIGMSIVANKVPGVRAALVYDRVSAKMAREHNDANVLVIGGRTTEKALARDMVSTWLGGRFEGGRHARRIAKIREIETRPRRRGGRALAESDPEVWDAVVGETRREEEGIVLIASENYAPESILAAQGSVFTNKYAEGYPGKRYYGGCEFVDRVETLAIDRAKALFGAEHANVQPISGSAANMAAYYALIEPGETILGMALDQGGHLTHGAAVSFSGRMFRVVTYGVGRENGVIDYGEIRDLALRERPRAILAGASSYSRALDFRAFREIADEAGAYLIVDMAHIAGLVAGGVHPSPIPHADVVTSTTHKTLRGPRGGLILCRKEYADAIDKAVFPGIQGGPLAHAIAAKAVTFREAASDSFRDYARRVVENARHLAKRLVERGYRVVSGGTDTHLFLLDLTPKRITGLEAERALDRAGITVNKNAIPYDGRGPFVTSGIRVGTPIVTTRGMGLAEMEEVADAMARVLENRDDENLSREVREAVRALCRRFPYYAHLLEPAT